MTSDTRDQTDAHTSPLPPSRARARVCVCACFLLMTVVHSLCVCEVFDISFSRLSRDLSFSCVMVAFTRWRIAPAVAPHVLAGTHAHGTPSLTKLLPTCAVVRARVLLDESVCDCIHACVWGTYLGTPCSTSLRYVRRGFLPRPHDAPTLFASFNSLYCSGRTGEQHEFERRGGGRMCSCLSVRINALVLQQLTQCT